MVIVRFVGGLGNQMFQYAVGRALSQHLRTPLKLDVSHYQDQGDGTPREYQLGIFHIAGEFLQENERALVRRWRGRGFHRLNGIANRLCPSLGMHYLSDQQNGFQRSVFEVHGNIYLDGYWQSERYSSGVADSLQREFTFKSAPDPSNQEMMTVMEESQAVCLHVRRGDYVHNPTANALHGTCSISYYEQAMQLIRERIQDPHFFVFSDDPEWTRAHLSPGSVTTYVTHNVGRQDQEDLRLMSSCKYFIIANSSFSWWGAWLGKHPDKVVVAPKIWFPTATERFSADITPAGWLRL